MKKLLSIIAVVALISTVAVVRPSFAGYQVSQIVLESASQVPSLDTSKIATGVFSTSRIPSLDTSKITTGAFDAARIGDLDTSKIATGVFADARIPSLDTSKINSGAFDSARIGSASIDTTKLLNAGISGTGTLLCYTNDGKIGKVTAIVDTGITGTCAAF